MLCAGRVNRRRQTLRPVWRAGTAATRCEADELRGLDPDCAPSSRSTPRTTWWQRAGALGASARRHPGQVTTERASTPTAAGLISRCSNPRYAARHPRYAGGDAHADDGLRGLPQHQHARAGPRRGPGGALRQRGRGRHRVRRGHAQPDAEAVQSRPVRNGRRGASHHPVLPGEPQ